MTLYFINVNSIIQAANGIQMRRVPWLSACIVIIGIMHVPQRKRSWIKRYEQASEVMHLWPRWSEIPVSPAWQAVGGMGIRSALPAVSRAEQSDVLYSGSLKAAVPNSHFPSPVYGKSQQDNTNGWVTSGSCGIHVLLKQGAWYET